MVKFEKFVLDNGLRVIVHEDINTPMAVVNIVYDVGARDEEEERTGFAHLFEHLMFGGSEHAPNFDKPLQQAGGESNAFTNNDITNYYDILPADNLEVALWLEADRMRALTIDKRSLEIQQKVVCEEFKENYLNQPYGDIWHKMCDLSYKVHPYKWPTIGKELAHVEHATLEDVKDFFAKYYAPNNAILVIAGPTPVDEASMLAEKWFGSIQGGSTPTFQYPKEPRQTESRHLETEADVPVNAIYKTYHMSKRDSKDYYAADIASDLLSGGSSSRFYQKLIKGKNLFSEVDAYVSGSMDEGLFIIEGKLKEGVTMQSADEAIQEEVWSLATNGATEYELTKVKNKQESYHTFAEVNLLNRAMNLAFYELLGDANRANSDIENYLAVTNGQIIDESANIFAPKNCSTIYYHAKN